MGVSAAAALSPLRHRSFAVLWTASLISNVGSWMQTVAVGALVISRTGSASWAVLVAAGAFLPIGLLSPLGGALADRLPRRPVIAAGNLTAGLIAAAIATLVAAGQDSPYALLALVTLQGSVCRADRPVRPGDPARPGAAVRVSRCQLAQLGAVERRPHRRPGTGRCSHRGLRLRRELRRERGQLPCRRHRAAVHPPRTAAGQPRAAAQLDAGTVCGPSGRSHPAGPRPSRSGSSRSSPRRSSRWCPRSR